MAPSPPAPDLPDPPPSLVPPPVPVETHPSRGGFRPPTYRTISDPNRLAPEDAYKAYSPPRLRPLVEDTAAGFGSLDASAAAAAALRPAVASLRPPPPIPVAARIEQDKKRRSGSRRRGQHATWKKLLWVKQSYPDNYTDTETFLDHLQRNPRLRPYDFWTLVSDSTVIVQHVGSVAIFICCFAGIYQDRVSPVAVVGCGSFTTVLCWLLWDRWMGQEEEEELEAIKADKGQASADPIDDGSSTSSGGSFNHVTSNGDANETPRPLSKKGLGLSLITSSLAGQAADRKTSTASKHSHTFSEASVQSVSPITPINPLSGSEEFPGLRLPPSRQSRTHYSPTTLPASLSPFTQSRLKTFKSALLIYFALLGLSPILKSLTKSTSSDSIWALATWLLIINIFFFDYGAVYLPSKADSTVLSTPSSSIPANSALAPANVSVAAPQYPSSLSTNAALMASTVLASRLPSTTHVFSLTLFSIEVFGLFPVFRRHLRHKSWTGHVALTCGLVVGASGGVGLILSNSYTHRYGACGFCLGWCWHAVSRWLLGTLIGGLGTAFVMGGCSWWLISLQRYKDVVIGPWDPARPILANGGGLRGRARD